MKVQRVLPAILLGIMISIGAPGFAYAKTSTCKASWYGPGFHGNTMANGKRFNQHDPSVVAHRTLPFGTVLQVVNKRNGRPHKVTVQDRGPFHGTRCLDFSEAAAKKLGFKDAGTTEIEFMVVH